MTSGSEAHSIDWHLLNFPLQSGLQRCVSDLNRMYRVKTRRCTCATARAKDFTGL